MNKIALFSLMFAILLSSTVLASVSLDISWQTAVETLRPGGETTISLTVSNTGTAVLTNVVITPSGGPDLTVTSGRMELGGFPASGSQQGSVAVRADNDASSRTSYVHLKVDYYTGTSTHSKTFTIPISIKREPILQIVNVDYNDTITPGKTVLLSFDVKNSGLGPARDLVVTLNQSDLFTIPGSAGEIVIDELGSESSSQVLFIMTIDPDADVGINSIPVTLGYYDETRVNTYSETKYIGLTVAGKIDFILTVEDAIGSMAKISIINRGTGSAEYLTVKATSGGIEKEYYIGSLDSDDTETIDFPQARSSGKYDVELELNYKDIFNNEYLETKTITVNPSIKISSTFLVVLIIIFAAGFWYYKKKYKKKK